MTTATRPRPATAKLPAHGTYARANGSPGYRPPCTCEPCLQRRRKVKKRYDVNRQLGRPSRIDGTVARRHIEDNLRPAMSLADLRDATGCAMSTIVELITRRRDEISIHTHNKIMALQPVGLNAHMLIDATGSRRRIQALQATGHNQATIAAAADTTPERIRLITKHQTQVRRAVANRIADAYQQLAQQPGTCELSAKRAAALGWRDPGYWDDTDRIDDPEFDPDAPEAPRYMRLGEDGLWLEGHGLTREQAAERLEVTKDYLDQSIRRYRIATAAEAAS